MTAHREEDHSRLDDPVVEEICRIWAELARKANYDLHTICERIREHERQAPEQPLGTSPAPHR